MKNYNLSDEDVQEIADKAAETALRKAGVIKSQISTNEAYQRYSRERVTKWRKLGLVTPVKQGKIIFWSVDDLEKAASRNILNN